jgi:aspartate aminotransferase
LDFSEFLIEQAGVALVPGSAFGAPGYIRISIATSMENLQNALLKIKQAV